MSSTLTFDVARAIGTAGVGLAAGKSTACVMNTFQLYLSTGAMLSTKTFIMPSLLNTPTLSSKDRLVTFVFQCSSGRTITKQNIALLQQTLRPRKVHHSCKIEIIPSIISNL